MQRLPHISSLEELSQFFAQLGYDPQARRQVEGRRLVARWNAFKVVATMSGNPERDAARIARELRSKQVRGLGVALQPATSLAIAAPRIGVSGVTRVLDVSLAAPTSYELVKLRLLRPAPESNALAHSLRVAEILDSEPAGDRFYTQFKIVYDRFVAEAPVRLAEPDRNLLALLPLTRVLFLYFLQAKTWLDGRPDYVRYQFGRCLSGNGQFHRDVLNRLFFGLLDTPRHLRHSHNLGDIPYLNGGLFRRHRLESRQTEFEFPNDVWREAIDDLFERFQFCAGAADDVDAIAPDMLGRVFERLGAAERGKTGTYYTPEVLVTELVAVSLASALTGRAGLDAEESRKIVQLDDGFNRRRAAEALKDIKIIDPAVGSGAFLLGALELLTKIWSKIHPHAARHAIRRRVLRDNLFGIDVDPQAVKLAELRLWLALVWDDPRQDSSRVEPLPNLDGVIRQGDTLMAPRHLAETPQSLKALRSREAQMCRIRRALFHASGKARQRLAARLHAVQVDLARDLLSLRQRTLESSVSDLVVASSSPDLFGAPSGKHARTLRRLRADLDSIEQDRVLLADGAVPFFSTEIHAPELADRGGFTLVIGNPPWVRAEKLDAITRDRLARRYDWWHGTTKRGYAHQPDLSVAFLQRAVELAAPEGTIGFLVPSKLATADYAVRARNALVRETTLEYLHRVPARQTVAFGATTYPMAIVVRKSKPVPSNHVRIGFRERVAVSQSLLSRRGPWILVERNAHEAVDHLLSAGEPLGSRSPAKLGVKTGCNYVFVGEAVAGRESLVKFGDELIEVPQEFIRPAIRGRDVRQFSAHPKRLLVWCYDSSLAPLRMLPAQLNRYFMRKTAVLSRRADYRGGELWTLFRVESLTRRFLVVWADIAKRPRAVVIDGRGRGSVPLNSCYVAGFDDGDLAHAVCTVVNSVWSEALVRMFGDEARGGYRRMNARVAARVPIPTRSDAIRRLGELGMRCHSHEIPGHEIDAAVATALRLPRRVRDRLRSIAADQ